MNGKELTQAIKPTLKPSYSPNLHAFVRAWCRRYCGRAPQVWRENADGMLWIGSQDDEQQARPTCGFVGVRLPRVLTTGAKAINEKGWYTNLGPGNMTHIADFWERYIEIGRCAIDTGHNQWFIGDEGRYVMDGDIRTCNWCGAKHKRRVEIEVIEREIESFEPIVGESEATSCPVDSCKFADDPQPHNKWQSKCRKCGFILPF